MRLWVLLPFLSAVAACGSARAASFDCARAGTPIERTICADAQLSAADSALGATYSEALAGARSPESIRAAQREWLANVRNKTPRPRDLLAAYTQQETWLRQQIAEQRFGSTQIDPRAAQGRCVRLPSVEGACRVVLAGALRGAPGPALSYQMQSYAGDPETQGVIVLTSNGDGSQRPLAWLGNPGATYDTPRLIPHENTWLLYLPGDSGGSASFPDDELLVWLGGEWRPVDTNSWISTLMARVPRGMSANKGLYPDWATMTVSTPLWQNDEPNCCPTGGTARATLRLNQTRLEVVSVAVSRPDRRR